MPSDTTYNNATANPAAHERSRDPRTCQHVVTAAFHLHRQPPNVAAACQAESLQCPRCDSKNTKFCYYNNYNLSQPRHFCKACRRYWTHGGTLRNIPVGGGIRKSTSISYPSSSNKRSRSSPATVSNCSSSSAVLGNDGAPITKPPEARSDMMTGFIASDDGVSEGSGRSPGTGFPSHLSMPSNNTFLTLGEYGLGSIPALDGFRFGFGQGVWPFAEAGFIDGGGYGGFRGPMVCPLGIEAWHVGPGGGGGSGMNGEGGGGGGLTEGDAFVCPELAISMPGQGLK